MKAEYDGEEVTFTMTRAEAHVIIWGGNKQTVDRLEVDMREALVKAEDALPEGEYIEIMKEVNLL